MCADDSTALISFALEHEEEEKIFERWVPLAQNVMSFDAFKESLKKQPGLVDEKSVVEDVMGIIRSMEQDHGNI